MDTIFGLVGTVFQIVFLSAYTRDRAESQETRDSNKKYTQYFNLCKKLEKVIKFDLKDVRQMNSDGKLFLELNLRTKLANYLVLEIKEFIKKNNIPSDYKIQQLCERI